MIAVPLAFAAGKLLSNRLSGLLFGFEPTDPTTIAGASVVLAMVAVTAVVLPARHATKVDPLTVLRT
jgi:ABC-type antimicrobial peptide transport system permease subunit